MTAGITVLLVCQLFPEDSEAELLHSAMYSFYTRTCSQGTVISKFHFRVVETTSPVSEVLPSMQICFIDVGSHGVSPP